MTANSYSIAQGDTSPVWRVGHLDGDGNELVLDGNYTCLIAVKGTAISRSVTAKTEDTRRFLASLTAAETATLTPGETYVVAVQLSNPSYTPALAQERQFRVFVREGVIT